MTWLDQNIMRRVLTVLAFLAAAPTSALPQQDDVQFEHLSVEQGLSNATVRRIVQDSLGFIWIGTEEGLNRFDGYSFTVYKHDPRDSSSISSNESILLCVDSRGNLWTAGGGSLDRYDRARDNFVHYRHDPRGLNGPPSETISAIAVDKKDNIWIASDSGLTRFDQHHQTFTHFRPDPGNPNAISEKAIACILPQDSATMWIGYGFDGIDRLEFVGDTEPRHLRVTRYRHDPNDKNSLSHNNVTGMVQDREGRLWIATFDGGMNVFDTLTRQFSSMSSQLALLSDSAPMTITAVCSDAKGNVWAGYFNEGLGMYDRGKGKLVRFRADLQNPHALNSDRVYALLKDNTGILWIGTHRGGLNRYDARKKRFRHVQHVKDDEKSLAHGVVSALWEDERGDVWIGLEDAGLDHFNPVTQRFTHYRHDPKDPWSISSNIVIAIVEDHAGKIWVRTSTGLDEFDKTTKRFHHHTFTSQFGESRGLMEGKNGDIWIGTINGFLCSPTRFERGTKTFVRSDNVTTEAEIQFIFQDAKDTVWFGTFGQGLYRFNIQTHTIVRYLHDPADPSTIGANGLYSIAEDRQRNIWIGLSGGLDRYDRATGHFEHFTERDGLASNFVKAILPDDRGNLWLSTTKGLSRFNPAKREFKNFSLEDGIQANEFRTGACFRTESGRMYFGGVNGYNVFHPDSILDNPIPPRVVLTRFNVFDRPYQLPEPIATIDEIRLSYSQDVFSFEFVALNFTNSQENVYAYKMESFDKEWVHSGTRRYASYTHLDPGEYVFRVKASNNDGIWNETGASVRLAVVPPFWMTWWFRVPAILALFAIAAWSIRSIEIRRIRETMQRLEREAALERERTRIARDMHDDLGARLTEIRMLSELTQRDPTDQRTVRTNLQDISDSAREIVDSFQEIVWSVNPSYDTLDNFADFLTQYASGYLGKAGLRCRLDIPAIVPGLKVSSEIRHNLMMVVKEALANIVKHAEASEVHLTLVCDDHLLSVSIRDDGRGFQQSGGRPFGNGLVNMRRRLESIGGEIRIESAEGTGTSVTMSVVIVEPKK